MSRWPPEIAGTISHPAGRSAVTAERVPIFYSARSSSPSSSSSTRRRILPFSLSHSLSSLVHPSPSPYAQRSQCVGPIQRLDENGPEPFSTPKRRTKGVAEDGRKHERKQMPRQRRLIYATPYPVLLFLLSPPASSHPLPSRHLPLPHPDISVPDRSGWDVCGLLLHCSQKSEEDPLN